VSKPRLLDLFCGAGGAAMGYHRAGFEVVGVDINPQPHYPFEFYQEDAVRVLRFGVSSLGGRFDAIHASPPCQAFSAAKSRNQHRGPSKHTDLLTPVRALLMATNLPWVIENVPGAPMRPDLVLCGSMFGLGVRRHRWFEGSPPLPPWSLAHDHSRPIIGVYGHGAGPSHERTDRGTVAQWKAAMDIDWMNRDELAQAIPPAYTALVGARLMASLVAVA
jgi:DNA (cytosine-5)-methyltransferase 1